MLKGLLFSETQQLMTRLGQRPGRAEVLSGWLYHDKRLIRDLDDAAGDDGDKSRRMGKATREKIQAVATADGGLRLEVCLSSCGILPHAVVSGCFMILQHKGGFV